MIYNNNDSNEDILNTMMVLREKKERRREKRERDQKEKKNTEIYCLYLERTLKKIMDCLPYFIDSISSLSSLSSISSISNITTVSENFLSKEINALKKNPISFYNKILIYLINNGIIQHGLYYRHFDLLLIHDSCEKGMLMERIKAVLMDGSLYNQEAREYIIEILNALLTFLTKYKKKASRVHEGGCCDGRSVRSPWDRIFEPGPISSKRPPLDPKTRFKIPTFEMLTQPSDFCYDTDTTIVSILKMDLDLDLDLDFL